MSMSKHSYLSLGPSGFHRIAYTDWGDATSRHVVICVHGLSRNGRDFDFLARALESRCRVVCPDVVGRGDSEWLADKSGYTFGTYLADAAALIARLTTPPRTSFLGELHRQLRTRLGETLAPQRLDWIGTSMGGLIGMLLAAKPGSPIRRLVLNDVGPLVPWNALLRLSATAHATRFADRGAAEAQLREACAPFGLDHEAQWTHLFEYGIEQDDDGSFVLRFDPALVQLQRTPDRELPLGPDFLRGVDVWSAWDAVTCPVLVLRGAESDVLLPDTVARMRARPNVHVVEFPGVGHAPALMNALQIGVVREFLLAGDDEIARSVEPG
ncbi:MAG TPA: alpha/beta hydrolase [Burkholderiaceae bacterium]|nr:alpha/beta hydrolase [Burkholderiaceae bacterium]